MAVYSFAPATPDVIPFLAERVRQSDVDELQAAAGMTPAEAMAGGLCESIKAWTGYLNGIPCCMFGVAPVEGSSEIGACWMTGTALVERHPRAFLEGSRLAFREMLKLRPTLINYVDARHKKALHWLRWLGAEIAEAEPYGVEGRPFHFFQVRR